MSSSFVGMFRGRGNEEVIGNQKVDEISVKCEHNTSNSSLQTCAKGIMHPYRRQPGIERQRLRQRRQMHQVLIAFSHLVHAHS